MIDMAQKEPVRITLHNQVVGVMVSTQDCDDMRPCYANRLKNTLQAVAASARGCGLTQDKLDGLLMGES